MADKKIEPINIQELRGILVEEMEKLRNDETTPARANAVNNTAGTILRSVKLEMEYARIIGLKPEIKFIAPPKEK